MTDATSVHRAIQYPRKCAQSSSHTKELMLTLTSAQVERAKCQPRASALAAHGVSTIVPVLASVPLMHSRCQPVAHMVQRISSAPSGRCTVWQVHCVWSWCQPRYASKGSSVASIPALTKRRKAHDGAFTFPFMG